MQGKCLLLFRVNGIGFQIVGATLGRGVAIEMRDYRMPDSARVFGRLLSCSIYSRLRDLALGRCQKRSYGGCQGEMTSTVLVKLPTWQARRLATVAP